MSLPEWLFEKNSVPFMAVDGTTPLARVMSKFIDRQYPPHTLLVVRLAKGEYASIFFLEIPDIGFEAPVAQLPLKPVTEVLDDRTTENPTRIERRLRSIPDALMVVVDEGRVIGVLHNPTASVVTEALSALRERFEQYAGRFRSDDVLFSAVYPGRVSPGRQWSFYVYAHTLNEFPKIIQDIRQVSPDSPTPEIQNSAAQRLRRGTTLRVQLESDRQAFRSVFYKQVWQGSWVRFQFDFEPAASLAGQTLNIQVRIFADGCEAAPPINCRIQVMQQPVSGDKTPMQQSTTRVYEKIFVCYSPADSAVVEPYRVWQKLRGDDVFMSVDSVRAGENRERQIKDAIESADIFQLFWSEPARQSDSVSQEWQHALTVSRRRGHDGSAFIRPVYWQQPMAARPDELKHIQFGYAPLSSLTLANNPFQQALEIAKPLLQSEFEPYHAAMHRLSEKLDRLEQGQSSILVVMQAIQSGLVSKSEMEEFLNLVKDALPELRQLASHLDENARADLNSAELVLQTDMGLQHKFELTIPLIPFILDYKVEGNIGTGVNLSKLLERWSSFKSRFSKSA